MSDKKEQSRAAPLEDLKSLPPSVIERRYGTSYFLATLFFPPEKRRAVAILYAFFRLPDEMVDSLVDSSEADRELENWERLWQISLSGKITGEHILDSTAKVFEFYKIPPFLADEFLSAMRLDLIKKDYTNHNELASYMRGSAGVVGIMLSHVIGFSDQRALDFASLLGEAMQLTNFLRDIKEDAITRDRVYFPIDLYSSYGLTRQDFFAQNSSDLFRKFVKDRVFEIREKYKEAEKGIVFLDFSGRLPVLIASRLYARILVKIEQMDYDVFLRRARVSGLEKFFIVLSCLFSLPKFRKFKP